jgi:tetratricopeptide (TPR) repeat protein
MKYMKSMLFFIHLLLILFFFSCKSKDTEDKKKKQHVKYENIIKDKPDAFLNDEAEKLNQQALKLVKNNNLLDAKALFLVCLKLEQNNVVALNNLGLIEKYFKNTNEATYYFQMAMKSDSSYFQSYLNYALMLFENEYYLKSIDINKYIIENCKDSELVGIAYLHNALSYFSLKKCKEAIEQQEKCIKQLGNYSEFEKNLSALDLYLGPCKAK